MAKRKPEPESTPVKFQHVTLSVSCPARQERRCALDDSRATIFYVNKDGQRTSARRIVGYVYSVEIRSARRKTGACYELLHTDVWSQPVGEAPKIPANALFIAKAFELAESA